ncbi:kilA-N domain protein [Pectobacterium brasiliense]|uniref:KilA-N domain protein n=1 Tax=Pectobacterium brasiliense TaxID=180957 RepID=A0A0M2F0U5_9GAMM|nr:KilA-N domain-containing protein [Pectobacterium brasiliense]KGA34257.1 kilA-N domain protein [Pectobacterium brasiliense]
MNTPVVIANIAVRRDADGRYNLNDLHRASGCEKRHAPSYWLANKQSADLIAELETTGIPVVKLEGRNGGTFVCRELVYAYAMWISPAFHLSVIRTFDSVANANPATGNISDRVQAGILIVESAARLLNLSNSSKLGAYQKLQSVIGIPNLMPSYAIDAPSDAADGSSRSTKSLTDLLRQHGFTMTAAIAYVRLEAAGIVERKTRPSTGKQFKSFWSVTSQGLRYGKNITSPANPRETQPHFFESRSEDLLAIISGRNVA